MAVTQPTELGLEAVKMVRELLPQVGWTPREQPFPGGISFVVEIDGPTPRGIAQVHTDIERFAFMFVFQDTVPVSARMNVAEFLARANWGLMEGNFEMNFDSGEVRYKAGIDFTSNGLTVPLVRNMILSGMENVEIFAHELIDVAEGRTDPQTAYLAARSRVQE